MLAMFRLKYTEYPKSGKETNDLHNFPYRQELGAFIHLMLGIRPELAYSVRCFVVNPRDTNK